jgi:hypothetical protein
MTLAVTKRREPYLPTIVRGALVAASAVQAAATPAAHAFSAPTPMAP